MLTGAGAAGKAFHKANTLAGAATKGREGSKRSTALNAENEIELKGMSKFNKTIETRPRRTSLHRVGGLNMTELEEVQSGSSIKNSS